MSRRTERIAEQIRAEIARVLREDVSDPRVRLVTLTRVDVAPDLSNAAVYWSHLDPRAGADLDSLAAGLEAAAGFVRRQLARVLPLRRVPELRFRRDPSLELGSRTLAVLGELSREREEREAAERAVTTDEDESREEHGET